MTNFGFIKREILLCSLLCLTVTLIEAVNRNELKKMNRKIDRMIGGLQGQLITAMLEIEDLRNSTPACECGHQTHTEHVDSQLGKTNSNEKTESDTQTIETLVEIIFNGFMDEKYARKQLEHQIETRIEETIKSQNNENNRLMKVITDINETNAVQHTEVQRLDALNEEVNIKSEKLKSALEEINNSSKSDRDEINRLIELMFDLNNTVITQHDEIERLNEEVSMFKTNAKLKYEEIDSLKKTVRVMTNTIDWMTTSIPICTKPESLNYGNVANSGTVMGSVVTYTCNEGYSLQGVNESKCLQNKQWDGEVPVCTPEKCFLHVNNDSKYWSQTKDSIGLITENKYIDHGSDVSIDCIDGYILTNAQDETAATRQTTHCYFGTWKNAYNCRPKKCPLPVFNNGITYTETGSLANGDAKDSTKIMFECKSKSRFELLNSADAVVQSLEANCRLGNWSSIIPKCRPKRCSLNVIYTTVFWMKTDESKREVITENTAIEHDVEVNIQCINDSYYLASTKDRNHIGGSIETAVCIYGKWQNAYSCTIIKETSYTLLVYTEPGYFDGTISSVDINIVGTNGSTGKLHLAPGFNRNSLYKTTLHGLNVGKITHVKLSLKDSSIDDSWKPKWIAFIDNFDSYCYMPIGSVITIDRPITVTISTDMCCKFEEAKKIDYPSMYLPKNPTSDVDATQCKLLCAYKFNCKGVIYHVTGRKCFVMGFFYQSQAEDKSYMVSWNVLFYKKI